MATETIRPTDATEFESWGTESNIWDDDLNTSASITNSNAAPSLSVGGGNVDAEDVDSWGSPAETWTAAELYVTFEWGPGAASDSIHAEYGYYTGGSFTAIADLVALTTSTVGKATFQDSLSTDDFGAGFSTIAQLRVRVNGDKDAGPDGATAHMYEVWVEGEYTLTPYEVTPAVSDMALAGLIPAADYTEDGGEVVFLNQMDEISQQMRIQTAAKLGGVLIE